MWELFIDELFNKCFHLQENAKKISSDSLFLFPQVLRKTKKKKKEKNVFWSSGEIEVWYRSNNIY